MKTKLNINGNEVVVKENAYDRLVRVFDPIKAEKRYRSRLRSAAAGGYSGASHKSRSLSQYNPMSGDADDALLVDLEELRDRSRDQVRNNPLAAGAINTVVSNVVGTGLKLNARINHEILGMSADEASEWQDRTEMEFKLWSESQECSSSNSMDFAMIQDVAFRSVLESGDVLSVCVSAPSRSIPYRTKVQLIEADRVLNENNKADTPKLTAGVKKNDSSAVVAYQVLDAHPNKRYMTSAKWREIPAYGRTTGLKKANLLFRPLRPGQTRGVPYLAPVIESLKQLGRYSEAELMAAVISGMFTVFVTSESGDGLADMIGASDNCDDEYKLGNGAIVDMAKGESIEMANPGRPNAAFDPFVQAVLRQIGVALEVPFEILIKHFTASYSASQAAILEAWRFFRVRREWLAKSFCQPIYENWLYEAVTLGRIVAPGFTHGDPLIRKAYCGSEWVGMPRMSIDKLKDAKAHDLYNKMGVMPLTDITTEISGGDWEAKHTQTVKENEKRKKDGLIVEVVTVVEADDTTLDDEQIDKKEGDDEAP